MRIGLRFLTIVIITVLLLSACGAPAVPDASPQPAPQGKLQAWVDAPLNESRLPLNVPYPVICHGADPGGIGAVEFSVNSAVLETYHNPEMNLMLVTSSFSWLPSFPGRTILECRAQNASGSWSDPARSVVIIEAGTPTPTLTPILTITPTPTQTVTLTPTTTPTPIAQENFVGPPVFKPTQINLPYDCPSTPLTAEINVSPFQSVEAITMFFRLAGKDFGKHSEWASITMNKVGSETYRVTFDPIKDSGLIPWLTANWSTTWEGWLTTQFLIRDAQGNYSRSEVNSLVKIGGCH